MKQAFIGTSGWSYPHWKSTFYPDGLKVKLQFPYYCQHFNTVEINNTFYRLPRKETFIHWKENTPDKFLFTVKASRFITHMKKLQDPVDSVTLFLEHAMLLEEKLGPILFQLPPFLLVNGELLEAFLSQLPEDFRYVFEFRNKTWYEERIYKLLRKYKCAFCIYDLEGHQSPLISTADFVYVRLHGPGGKYQGSYSDKKLTVWADQCKTWLLKKDVYVYFDNDEAGYAAFNGVRLRELLNA